MKSGRWIILLGIILNLLTVVLVPMDAFSSVEIKKNESGENSTVSNIKQQINPAFSLVLAKYYANQYDYKKALNTLLPYTASPTEHPRIYSDYLVILTWDGQHDRAISLFEQLPSQFVKRPYLLRNIAKSYFDKREYEKSSSVYESALKQDENDKETIKGYLLSTTYSGQYERASLFLDNPTVQGSEDPAIVSTRLCLQVLNKNYSSANTLYQTLSKKNSGKVDEVLDLFQKQMARLPLSEKKNIENHIKNASDQVDVNIRKFQIFVLSLLKNFDEVTNLYEKLGLSFEDLPDHLNAYVAWAYFQTNHFNQAETIYLKLLQKNPLSIQASIGRIYCLSGKGEYKAAKELTDDLLTEHPRNIDILFVSAFNSEKSRQFLSAVHTYDQILSIYPNHKTAHALRLRALSDLGATTLALSEVPSEILNEEKIENEIIADNAVDHLKWEEFDKAKSIFYALMTKDDSLRYQYDYMITLALSDNYDAAIGVYEGLVQKDITPPFWVIEKAGQSYLSTHQPEKALELYDMALIKNPDSLPALWGKFYALQDLRKWKEAEKTLHSIRLKTESAAHGKNAQLRREEQMDLAIANAWFLAHQNRLSESQDRFQNLYEQAPGNVEVRNGLYHVYMWRGWERKAKEGFNILKSLNPSFTPASPGRLQAENRLGLKFSAREQLNDLLIKYPRNRELIELKRKFEVEQMNRFETRADFDREDDTTTEFAIEFKFSMPVSLKTELFTFLKWKRSWVEFPSREDVINGDDDEILQRIAGFGIRHRFNELLEVEQQFSADYQDGDDFGSYTAFTFTPDDHWMFSVSYDSFYSNLPAKARRRDITATALSLTSSYRSSEELQLMGTYRMQTLSDGNIINEVMLGSDLQLYSKNDIEMRLFVNGYMATRSEDDEEIEYFNPKRSLKITGTHMTQHVAWQRNDQSFLHRLYLTAGNSWQESYGSDLVGAVRYEHAYAFSDTHNLSWGAETNRNAYDGEEVDTFHLDMLYEWRF